MEIHKDIVDLMIAQINEDIEEYGTRMPIYYTIGKLLEENNNYKVLIDFLDDDRREILKSKYGSI